ncbi:hypothetical protein THRCLA_03629 [Thraustotheca clavata]|uniref:Uncharacterized protein n=1 Tax=Thraustotheca clavata TaxID=74557 RepID=A0A1W0A1E3_9STRA|nr:hypothetical protein THRCLA_03629 [Thraustotheca clavata]
MSVAHAHHSAMLHQAALDYSKRDIPQLQAMIQDAKQDLQDGYAKIAVLEEENEQCVSRIKQLEQDVESIVNHTSEANISKEKLQRRLSDIGGHEHTLMILKKSLLETKAEITRHRNEKASLTNNRKESEKELLALHKLLSKSKANSISYQQEIDLMMEKKLQIQNELNEIAASLS